MDPTPELMELLHHAHEWLRVPLLCSIQAGQLDFCAALGWGHELSELRAQLAAIPLSIEHPVLQHIIGHGVCSFGTATQLGTERWFDAFEIETSDQMFCIPVQEQGRITHLLIGDPRSKGSSIQETFELLEPLTDRVDAFDTSMEESSVYEISHAQEISEIYEDSVAEATTSTQSEPVLDEAAADELDMDGPTVEPPAASSGAGERAEDAHLESDPALDGDDDSGLEEDSLDYILEEISAPEESEASEDSHTTEDSLTTGALDRGDATAAAPAQETPSRDEVEEVNGEPSPQDDDRDREGPSDQPASPTADQPKPDEDPTSEDTDHGEPEVRASEEATPLDDDDLEVSAEARALLEVIAGKDVRASMRAGGELDANLGVWRELAGMFPGRLVIDRFQYPLATLPTMRMHSGVLAACARNLPAPPDVLTELLQSRNVDACFYACWLATHGAPDDLIPALAVHLTQRDKQIVQMARAAIYRVSALSQDHSAIAAQITLFRDAVTIERGKAAAMETLGMLGGAEHISDLIGSLADPSATIRRAAHMGLKRYSFVNLPEDRSRWLQWWRVNQNTPRWQLMMRAMADESIEIRRLVHELLVAHPHYTGEYRPNAPAAVLQRHQTQARLWLETNIA